MRRCGEQALLQIYVSIYLETGNYISTKRIKGRGIPDIYRLKSAMPSSGSCGGTKSLAIINAVRYDVTHLHQHNNRMRYVILFYGGGWACE